MELNLCWSCSVPLYDYYTDNISNGPNISTVFLKKDRGNWWGTPCQSLLRVNHLSELILKQDHPAIVIYKQFLAIPNKKDRKELTPVPVPKNNE